MTIAAIFTPDYPPEALHETAVAAEAARVPELWVWEDCFKESAIGPVAAALAWTTSIRLGIGIAPMPLRNVALTAMEFATIERMFPGRFIPGVGHGVLSWMAQAGARVESPLTLMREYVPALRALLAGSEVTTSGRYVSLDQVCLDWPPQHGLPIYAAGGGPRTLELAGELADGTVLAGGISPERTAELCSLVRAAHAQAGRTDHHPIVVNLMAVFGADATSRATAAMDRLEVPDGERIVAAGDPAAVADVIARYMRAGADTVGLQPIDEGPHLIDFVQNVGEVARLVGSP